MRRGCWVVHCDEPRESFWFDIIEFCTIMGDSEDIKYLKQDHIGKVIARGLATVYEQKPSKPITYFANWLLNYSHNQKQIESIKGQQEAKKVNLNEHNQLTQLKSELQENQNKLQKQTSEKHRQFEERIKNEEYHLELLLSELPQFLEDNLQLTGVYIGELNYPSKAVTEQDTDLNAHLSTDAPKLIKYIGSSLSHKEIMIGKTLPPDKGVTYEVFTPTPSNVEEGGEPAVEKPKYVYVPDVIQNEKVHYFRIPKLGAYIAMPLVYKSYLSEGTFDFSLDETKKHTEQKEDFQKEKTTQLEELKNEIAEAKKRQDAFKDKQDEAQAEAVAEEIKELETKVADKEAETLEYTSPETIFETREFVVCGDTLGQDKEISQESRDFLARFVQLFKSQWEERERELLRKDVQRQMNHEKSMETPVKELVEELNQEMERIPEELETELNEKYRENEKLLTFETQAAKLEILKSWLQKPQIQQSILKLKEFRILKFPALVQNLLYLLGYKKQEVDVAGTTHLNWKYARQSLINQNFVNSVANYVFRGFKMSEFRSYEKVEPLLAAFEKVPEEQVFEYNIGLGVLLKYVKAALKLRKEDVEIRRANYEEQKTKREEKEQQNQKIQEEKDLALEKHRGSLTTEEVEDFNEATWIQEYEQEHPFVQIPSEGQADIDNDI